MVGNPQKTSAARALNQFAAQKALDKIQETGRSLPCHVVKVSGSIVTVHFDINSDFTLPEVTCPLFGPEWIRYPVQVGELGFVVSADYYLGGVSGLGGGVASLIQMANLSALVFFPVANKNWTPSEDPNKLVLYGPDGAVLRTLDKTSAITVDKDTGILIKSSVAVRIQAPSIKSSQS